MNTLPPELFDIIFNNINDIKDKKALLKTCKKYWLQYKRLMHNVVYITYHVTLEMNYNFDVLCICDNINLCKEYIKKRIQGNSCFVNYGLNNLMTKDNDYTLLTTRYRLQEHANNICTEGFIIEEIYINKYLW